jgi:hypothetical protein
VRGFNWDAENRLNQDERFLEDSSCLAAAVLLPQFPGAIQRQGGICQFLHALMSDLRQPELYRLGLGAGDGLDQPQEGFGGGHVREVMLAICGE